MARAHGMLVALVLAMVCAAHVVEAEGRTGRKLQQGWCWVRGRYVRCGGGGRGSSSSLNQQQFANSLAIQNTQDAIEYAATQGDGGDAAFAARYGALQNRCAAAQDWLCLTSGWPWYGRKLLGSRAVRLQA